MVMDGAVKKWQCVLCGKMAKLKADILDHVEAKHMDNSFLYNCRYCSKVVNTNGNLRTHEVNGCNSVHIVLLSGLCDVFNLWGTMGLWLMVYLRSSG